ncbi:porin [Acinetobacter seifertii]|uniref:porin n=1 Tax=Acinetobacter seifertii TaxID=1530123 RepID=UPI001E3B4D10|nr:porin [Acinetobacter seifertii]
MMNKFLVYCTIFVPLSAFADIQVGGENSPLKVYGIIDYGLNYSHSNVESSYSFQSGMDYASRIGLKLNYKLNDDFSIIGNVESWIDLKEMEFVRETPFARSEFIGVNSDTYGKLVYGRIMPSVAGALEELFATPFSPTSIAVQAYDLGFGAPTYDVRTSKSISYTTPKYNNSTLTIVYSPNQMVGEAPAVTNAKLYGALYIYDNGVNRISASYNELVSNNSVNYNNQILNDIKTKDYRALVQKKLIKI